MDLEAYNKTIMEEVSYEQKLLDVYLPKDQTSTQMQKDNIKKRITMRIILINNEIKSSSNEEEPEPTKEEKNEIKKEEPEKPKEENTNNNTKKNRRIPINKKQNMSIYFFSNIYPQEITLKKMN